MQRCRLQAEKHRCQALQHRRKSRYHVCRDVAAADDHHPAFQLRLLAAVDPAHEVDDKGGMNFSFINSAGQYQLEAKKYVRRIRDKVPYSDWDKEQLQDANSSWMVEDSFPRALREYNEMVDDYNSLR